MLVFDLRALGAGAASVNTVLDPDDPVWRADDRRPIGPIHVVGRLSLAGGAGDRFYFTGRMTGHAADSCRRCLVDVRTPIDEPVTALFLADGTEGSDDPDVFAFDPRLHELDLRPAVREAWVLSVPPLVLCREDCQGLCPTCGTDRNVERCTCASSVDARWAPLAALRESTN
jgi:uncharacterized protein